jgi:mxaD protein
MKRFAVALWALLLPAAGLAENRSLLVVSEMIEIEAPPAKVWSFAKRFDGLKEWHPLFSGSEIVSGRDGKIGAVRALTIKEGPTFTEELLALNEQSMAFSYNVIESPLPIDRYLSTMTVKPNGRGGSTVTWIGQFSRKNPRESPPEAESDAAVVGLISGAYSDGLKNLKKLMEQR